MFRFHSLGPHFSGGYKAMNVVLEEDPVAGTGALWLGDFTAAQDKITLKSKGIRTVLTVAQGLNISYPAGSEISHKTYNILDIESANISKIWADTYLRIEEGLKKGGVLVHCAAGVSRSASTVIAYIMRSKGWGFQETLNFVRQKRPVICPNFGFQRQLRQFEKETKTITIQPNNQQQQQSQQTQQPVYQPSKEQQKMIYYHQLQQAWNPEVLTPSKDNATIQQNEMSPMKRKDPGAPRQQSKTASRNPFGYSAEKQTYSSASRKPVGIGAHQQQLRQIDKQLQSKHQGLALSVKPYTPALTQKPQRAPK